MHCANVTYKVGETVFLKNKQKNHRKKVLQFFTSAWMKVWSIACLPQKTTISLLKTYFKDLNLIAYCTHERDYELNWTPMCSRLSGQQPSFHLLFSIQYCGAGFPDPTPVSVEVRVCVGREIITELFLLDFAGSCGASLDALSISDASPYV